jgi:hypothetical protein
MKTIRQVLSNLPDEVRDMAIISAILAGGREELDEPMCTTCMGNQEVVSALMNSLDMEQALGGWYFWAEVILRLQGDNRIMLYIDIDKRNYIESLLIMRAGGLPVESIDPIIATTQPRLNTEAIILEPNQVRFIKEIKVTIKNQAKYDKNYFIWN